MLRGARPISGGGLLVRGVLISGASVSRRRSPGAEARRRAAPLGDRYRKLALRRAAGVRGHASASIDGIIRARRDNAPESCRERQLARSSACVVKGSNRAGDARRAKAVGRNRHSGGDDRRIAHAPPYAAMCSSLRATFFGGGPHANGIGR